MNFLFRDAMPRSIIVNGVSHAIIDWSIQEEFVPGLVNPVPIPALQYLVVTVDGQVDVQETEAHLEYLFGEDSFYRISVFVYEVELQASSTKISVRQGNREKLTPYDKG
jgi:hypothetical protein